MKTAISIIVPVYNEAGNIRNLVERIDKTLKQHHIGYEILIIDDRSDDGTDKVVQSLQDRYRIGRFVKKGKKGKAQSIIEGFAYVNTVKSPPSASRKFMFRNHPSDYIVIIDGDLQYPPETIPEMIRALKDGLDIVIAKRQYVDSNIVRHVSGGIFSYLFGRLLHGFPYDVQSGLKAFRSSVADQADIRPRSGWMFDLEFLLQARTAGFRIGEVPMSFEKRTQGTSKVHLISASLEMAVEAIRLKFRDSGFLPFTPATQEKKGAGFYYRGREYVHYSKLHLNTSAFKRFTPGQVIGLSALTLLIAASLYLNRHLAVESMVSLLTVLYFLDLLFLFYLVYAAIAYDPSIKISDEQLRGIRDGDLPVYTVLCPLYKEAGVLRQFTSSISQLDYPKDKLQVLILLEEDDTESQAEIAALGLPSYFEVHVIPQSRPKTKPKALNYGLQYARGELLVIYDAEDIPDADQLKKVWTTFQHADPKVTCVQAKLHYYNTEQNTLTRLFSIEYLLMFDLILPGLQAIHAPIPLGGTSNHFRTETLRELHGWDAFNVTEDADLGIRLYKAGYRTEIVDSLTLEEASSRVPNWIKQRTRWIKGYMQTYFVHIRNRKLTFDVTNPHLLTFHLIMGWKSLFLLVNPFLWLMTISYFVFRPQLGGLIESFFPSTILYIGSIVLITGNFLYCYMYLIALGKRSQWNLAIYVFLVPFYWLLMSFAAVSALVEFAVKPHHWNKTVHGQYPGRVEVPEAQAPVGTGRFIPRWRRGAYYGQKY